MKTILFDEQCMGWDKNIDHNLMFLTTRADYIKEVLMQRGYIYLNQIYECLGAQWNPNLVNVCYRSTSGPIEFEFEPISDVKAILVKIG